MCQPGQKVWASLLRICVSVCMYLFVYPMDRCVDDSIPLKKGWERDGDREDSRWLTALPWGLVEGWRGIHERHSVWSCQSLASALLHVTCGPSNTQAHVSHSVSHHPSSQITLCLPPVTQPRQKRIYRHLVIYHHQGQWPATEKNSKDIDRTTVGVGVAFTAVREEKI